MIFCVGGCVTGGFRFLLAKRFSGVDQQRVWYILSKLIRPVIRLWKKNSTWREKTLLGGAGG